MKTVRMVMSIFVLMFGFVSTAVAEDEEWMWRDYSVKPKVNEDRHRCSVPDIKRIMNNKWVFGSWTGEYTTAYVPSWLKREGNIVKAYMRMFPTNISITSTDHNEGYMDVMVEFDTKRKLMKITDAHGYTCASRDNQQYRAARVWEPIQSEEFILFYRNVISKVK